MNKTLITLLTSLALLQGCAGLVAAGGATGANMITDRRTIGTQINDQTIEMRALHRLGEEKPMWDESRFAVIATNGKVLLIGQTPTEQYRARAEAIVTEVPGVKEVFNEVRVGTPLTLTQQSKDTWLTSKVKSTLLAEKNIDGTKLKVVTENTEVFLVGLVTRNEADVAVQLTRNVAGVSRVVTAFEYIQNVP
ncbi:division/outer membrane stress-associated lipid-binding lipoprotein [Oceanimonas baumannii]|uniref:Osmotically-inducible protein OsmY n=1 Tax=Oceanimonas baumannii TaxID=129578 RepID=A0A235CL70_9GAMM|nr:division/outer membrane stress-associated lipid-binding lipoprotein [Oceanimonas baumannii]OYD24595.1 osmotically-inducible protein OsmY [Oceanimonas baumannii]TDW59332.1 osmotically-inducible protein OsmY [Oceanimonas baumannii]